MSPRQRRTPVTREVILDDVEPRAATCQMVACVEPSIGYVEVASDGPIVRRRICAYHRDLLRRLFDVPSLPPRIRARSFVAELTLAIERAFEVDVDRDDLTVTPAAEETLLVLP